MIISIILVSVLIITLFIIPGIPVHRKANKQRVPVIGEKWFFEGLNGEDDSPWPSTKKPRFSPVIILDVKEGWVRYRIGAFYPDERLKMESFLSMYTPSKEKTN